MTRSELEQRLRSENVYRERGKKSWLKEFASEHEACEYLHMKIRDMLRFT